MWQQWQNMGTQNVELTQQKTKSKIPTFMHVFAKTVESQKHGTNHQSPTT